jgi:hypothetical protein
MTQSLSDKLAQPYISPAPIGLCQVIHFAPVTQRAPGESGKHMSTAAEKIATTFRLALVLLLPAACAAQAIQGYVRNGTSGRPEPAHQVVLFTTQGSQGSAITDNEGAFRIDSAKINPHSLAILKVVHDGVEYFQPMSNRPSTNVTVYEASSQVSGISGYLSVLQFQVKGSLLQVTELHAFNNTSNPPVTRFGAGNLVLSIPDHAQLEPATVSGPDGGTTKLSLVSIPGQKGKYTIDFPMKPGMTKYAINYQVLYDGKLVFRREAQYPMKRIGIILPASMKFQSLGSTMFHAESAQAGMHEQVLDNVGANQQFAFEISGMGALSHYFRPLKPGEAPMPAKASALTAPFPRAEPAAKVNPMRGRAFSAAFQLTVAATILIVAGIAIWGMMRRKILPT